MIKMIINPDVYSLDLQKIMEFVNKDEGRKYTEREITDTYDFTTNYNDDHSSSKVIKEINSSGNDQIDNIRYDLVKVLIGQIFTSEEEMAAYGHYGIGTTIATNTLIDSGFLVNRE